jgi:aerobic carbon-monoxide dehydrogenase medium subunit
VLRPKEFCLPDDGDEVVDLLERYGDAALILAGGSFVHGLEARGVLSEIEVLIDLQEVGLGAVETESEGLLAGAMVTAAALEQAPAVRNDPRLGALCDALAYLPVQIRNVATVGGCVAAACPFFDLPVAFIALDGAVDARGPGGTRTIGLEEFFTGMFESSLLPGEFLVELRLPQAPSRSASAFLKLETNASDLAIVNAAVCVTLDDRGACADTRIVLGGVGSTPVRSPSAERLLRGATLDEEVLREAGEAVAADIEPLSDHRASSAYRRAVAKVLVRRALERAHTRLNGARSGA